MTTVQTYVVQVRDRIGRPIMLASDGRAPSQPALWGANADHGPTVFVDVEEALTFCVNMQREFPNLTYWLIPANEVQVGQPEVQGGYVRADFARVGETVRQAAINPLAFGRD